jgi:hypothetical protein
MASVQVVGVFVHLKIGLVSLFPCIQRAGLTCDVAVRAHAEGPEVHFVRAPGFAPCQCGVADAAGMWQGCCAYGIAWCLVSAM